MIISIKYFNLTAMQGTIIAQMTLRYMVEQVREMPKDYA